MGTDADRAAGAPDAVLVCGLLAAGPEREEQARSLLLAAYGPILLASTPVPFAWTSYYAAEMGDGLIRRFLAFERPFYPGDLGEAKRATCELEREHADGANRSFNLDPGYLTLSSLVVASTKEASYRVYLGSGTYAQPMLVYRRGRFQPYEWTYADYRDPAHLEFFGEVRRLAREWGILLPRQSG